MDSQLRDRVAEAIAGLHMPPLLVDERAAERALAALGLEDLDGAAERIARHLYALGYGYDIDADLVARRSMLAVARGALGAALTCAVTEGAEVS